MPNCCRCGSYAPQAFHCACTGEDKAVYVCGEDACRMFGCPDCRRYVAGGEIWTESGTMTRPTGSSTTEPGRGSKLSEDGSSCNETAGVSMGTMSVDAIEAARMHADSKYLILLDFQHTLLRYDGPRTEIRPFAGELVLCLLQKQKEGLCQLGFRSTKAGRNAIPLAQRLLRQATSVEWVADSAHGDRRLQDTSSPGRSVWLVHGDLSHHNPLARHDKSQTPMQILDLETVVYEFEDIADGTRFTTSSRVFVTCDGTKSGTHVNEASAQNMLKVEGWKWIPEDDELRRLASYFVHFFQRRPSDAREHLQKHVFDQRFV
ncbi:unnamed protein product [Symbiodinium sp. CCMP2456]|nr:unnamed protein product [Symbiodinium sp. CCMP2456]